MSAGKIIKTFDGETAIYRNCCEFNEGVDCAQFHRHCERCGWNPAVSAARVQQFCKKHGIAFPLPKKAAEE